MVSYAARPLLALTPRRRAAVPAASHGTFFMNAPEPSTPPSADASPPNTPAEAAPAPPSPVSDLTRHSLTEDALALFSATLLIALGVAIYSRDHLLSGGMAGLAFLLHYATGYSFGKVFFVLNLPFYVLAWRQMDRAFVLKTMTAVALLSVMTEITPQLVSFETLHPAYAAVLGGLLMGVGFLMLFRHRASLGGIGILAFYLQESRGWKAGHIQMAVDCVIVLLALWTAPMSHVALSIGGAVMLNLILTMNHRKDRYIAS